VWDSVLALGENRPLRARGQYKERRGGGYGRLLFIVTQWPPSP
jgi:hypothetical protein